MGQKEQAARAVNVRAMQLIRATFESSGMTQQDLADDSGIPRSTLANILSKTAEPRLIHVEQLVRLALALNEDPREWIADLEKIAKRERPVRFSRTTGVAVPVLQEGRRKRSGGAARS